MVTSKHDAQTAVVVDRGRKRLRESSAETEEKSVHSYSVCGHPRLTRERLTSTY